jgi:RNA polymerase sigma-70 factor, ECF subfamily
MTAAVLDTCGQQRQVQVDEQALQTWGLVQRSQAGDMTAFGDLHRRYADTVFRFIYSRTGHRQVSQDLSSEVWVRALQRISNFTWQGRDLGAWLVTIARNIVADHFKSGRYRLEVTTGAVLDADREDRGPEGSPESAVVDHITNVALLTAVKRLNPEQQECIVLRFLQGFSVAETAQAMGKNEGAVKTLQWRAVRTLARMLELADPDDPSAGFIALPPPAPMSPPPEPVVDGSPAALRAWARANQLAPPARGTVPGWPREAYAAAMTGERVGVDA